MLNAVPSLYLPTMMLLAQQTFEKHIFEYPIISARTGITHHVQAISRDIGALRFPRVTFMQQFMASKT